MITAREIANKRFEKASFGGYRSDEVDSFLNEVAAELEALEEQNNTLNKKLDVLAEKLEEYRGDEESLRSALLGAQKLGDSVIRESKNKAEIIMRDATIKADRMVSSAHDQVEREKMIYLKLQKDVSAFKSKLLAIYRQHLEIISSLPEESAEDKANVRQHEAAEEAPEPENLMEQSGEEAAEESVNAAADNREAEEYYQVQFEEESVVVSRQEEEEPLEPQRPPVQRYEERGEERAAPVNDYEEARPPRQPQKFIPVPPRRSEAASSSGKFDEYYEDFDDEDSKLEVPTDTHKKSKFGTLKFGAGYDLKRD